MDRRLAIVVLLVSLAACGPSSARSSSATAGCGPSSAHTIGASRVARVYSLGNAVYGCSIHGAKSYRLGSASPSIREGRVGPVAVAGDVAAYGLQRHGVDTASAEVVARRLTDGRMLRSAPATTKPLGPEFFQNVESVVAKPDGAVAWIAMAGSIISRRRTDTEVQKSDRLGTRLLDSGGTIDATSLRLRGSTVSWKHGGSTRRAALG